MLLLLFVYKVETDNEIHEGSFWAIAYAASRC